MDPTSAIRKLGFRRWYERELIKCHAALVTCLLCGVLMAALIETIDFSQFGWQPASSLGVVIGAAVIAWLSWRSYITILQRAEFYGERSNCPSCGIYGRFDVMSTGMDEHPGRVADAVAPLPAAWMRVQCRMCQTAWRMPE
jgi:hypothetical protein